MNLFEHVINAKKNTVNLVFSSNQKNAKYSGHVQQVFECRPSVTAPRCHSSLTHLHQPVRCVLHLRSQNLSATVSEDLLCSFLTTQLE